MLTVWFKTECVTRSVVVTESNVKGCRVVIVDNRWICSTRILALHPNYQIISKFPWICVVSLMRVDSSGNVVSDSIESLYRERHMQNFLHRNGRMFSINDNYNPSKWHSLVILKLTYEDIPSCMPFIIQNFRDIERKTWNCESSKTFLCDALRDCVSSKGDIVICESPIPLPVMTKARREC